MYQGLFRRSPVEGQTFGLVSIFVTMNRAAAINVAYSILFSLEQILANLFSKGPHSKYFAGQPSVATQLSCSRKQPNI